VYRGTVWYLTTIEDVATRQVIAKRMGKRHDSHLVLATLQQALAIGHKPQIFHSDQGSEFMAQRCTDFLEQRGVQISVSDVASPWQNGYIESFYGRLKHELGDLNRFETLGEMIEAVYWHIHYYNHQRIHTARLSLNQMNKRNNQSCQSAQVCSNSVCQYARKSSIGVPSGNLLLK